MMELLATIDTDALLKTVVAALVASVGVTAVVSLTILGTGRSTYAWREGRQLRAALYAALALAGLLATGVLVAVGIAIMTTK